MVVIEKTSSLSSSSSSRRKEKQSLSCQIDNSGLLREKIIRRASSFSCSSPSSKKKKASTSVQKDAHEPPKEKCIRRSSSFASSSPSSTKREKRSVSTSQKEIQPSKEKRAEARRTALKSRLKEMGPICKKRKEILQEVPVSVQVEEDVDFCLNKQIQEEGKANPDDCLWLSSGSMSPQEFGLFMSALDPCLDEWVISFIPNSFDGSRANCISKASCDEDLQVVQEIANEVKESVDSSSSLALSTYSAESSSFWNMDRTGVWVSLINLDGEDSKWLSDVDSQLEELESDFPSPNWDSYSSSDVGFSSSARSTQDNSQSEWSSELLSDSMDWELDSDDPIFWPFDKDFDWDNQGWESFSVSPRKGVCAIKFESGKEGCTTPGSVRFRVHARKGSSKEGIKRKILFVSGLSASKIIEFKKGCRKNAAASGRGRKFLSKIGKRACRYKRRVHPILENILEEGKSPKETPKAKLSSDMLSESTGWGDEMDTDGPLFWPSDQKNDFDLTWNCFNLSPRKGTQHCSAYNNLGSPKGGFSVSSSVRLRFHPKKGKRSTPGLGASRSFNFKPSSFKSNAAYRRMEKAPPLRVSKSSKNLVVIFPSTTKSVFKSAESKHGSCRTNASHGKRIKTIPLKFGGKTVNEIMRLVSFIGQNNQFPEVESTARNPIESVIGLNEFDGHEGVEAEFEDQSFSLEDCMRE